MRYTFDSGVRAPLRVPAHRCRSDNAFPHAAEAAVDAIAQAPSCGLPVTNPSI